MVHFNFHGLRPCNSCVPLLLVRTLGVTTSGLMCTFQPNVPQSQGALPAKHGGVAGRGVSAPTVGGARR
jgi:hypothetical protein